MGSFSVPIEIGDPDGQRFESLEALVDSAATYTSVPRDVLGRLGVQPTQNRLFEFADGRQVYYGVAWLTIRLEGMLQPTLVVFGAAGTEPLLGVVTLEEFGLGIDPLNQRLVPVPALLKRLRTSD